MRTSIISLFFVVASTAPAWATSSVEDARFATPGSACRAISGTATYNSTGIIRNDSTSTDLYVDCPLGYLTSGQNPGSQVYVVGVVSPNGTGIPCTFIIDNLDAGGSFSLGTLSAATAGRRTLGGMVTTYAGANSSMHAYCKIPRKSASLVPAWIYGFEVDGQ